MDEKNLEPGHEVERMADAPPAPSENPLAPPAEPPPSPESTPSGAPATAAAEATSGGPATSVGSPAAAAVQPPPVEALPSGSGPETIVCVIHPAMFKARPFRFMLILLLLIGGITLGVWGSIQDPGTLWTRIGTWAGFLVAIGGGFWWFAWWFRSSKCIKLSISNKRSVRHDGFIRRDTTEVLHDHVRSVDIRQTLLQRIFNVGYIGVDTAGQDGIEIEIDDIPRPYQVKEVIDRYRQL